MEKQGHVQMDSLFMQAFHYAPVGMAIVDMNIKVLQVNEAGCRLLGYTAEELTARTFFDYSCPDAEEDYSHIMQELRNGGRDSFQTEKRFLHKNGSIIWLYLGISFAKNSEIEPDFYIFQFKDITKHKQGEKKLQKICKEYELLTEHSLDMITKHLPNCEITYVSKACELLLDYEQAELTGKFPYHYIHPDDREMLKKYMASTMDKQAVHTLPYRIRRRDGEYGWFESTAKGILNEAGDVEEILAFTRDITKRKAAERKLKEREEYYKSLFEYHPDIIFSTDLQGNFTSANPNFEKFMGSPKEALMSKKFHFGLLTAPQHLQRIETSFLKAACGDVQRYEFDGIDKNGSLLTLDVLNIPIRVEGKVVGVYGVARNISERKQNENEIRSTKRQLESFIENNVDPVFIYNLEDKLVKINKAVEATYGWQSDELLGLALKDLPIFPKSDIEWVQRNADDLAKVLGNTFKGLEAKRIKKDGTAIHVSVSGFQIVNEKNEQIGRAIIHRDVTEAKMAEEILINSEKLSIAGQLAAGIAHEIRNPMTAIKGFIQLLTSEFTSRKDYFDIISSEIERIELIISELLLLSKPQEMKFHQANIVSVLSEIKLLLETQAILNNVEINFVSVAARIDIYCEVNQIKQVCINFIQNAIEAMPAGGKLTVEISQASEGEVLIRFIDQGCGIAPEMLQKLGEPFYTTKEHGTGLGFMVSKRIIENHGGRVHVRSELEKGTTIEVYLPR
ncbi:two-component system, sporulation sensor kinase A [Evansella caseinilytica]|uniref:histidine kinase n=1 Tax=Evansella caseinilytica TaxID=1503961 RepID=A0A1H3IYX7_9BACI|nr:PAS domain S-box protein [Evansella caseinilytica]SDY32388.1 two-component system, sporulation sensor kinase A [Evansella caseinilytica]